MRLTLLDSTTIGAFLCVILAICGCSQGLSGGKRVAAQKALDSIEMFRRYHGTLDGIKRDIEEAKRAGDPSRYADEKTTIDLIGCQTAIGLYENYESESQQQQVNAAVPALGEINRRTERELEKKGIKPLNVEEMRKTAYEALAFCVEQLRGDLSQ